MNWDYVAGFVDGEGSLTIAKRLRGKNPQYAASLAVGNTSEKVIKQIHSFLGIKSKISFTTASSNRRALWVLRVDSDMLVSVLQHLADKLVVKREQAELLLEFLSLVGAPSQRTTAETREKMAKLAEYNSFLNHFGNTEE